MFPLFHFFCIINWIFAFPADHGYRWIGVSDLITHWIIKMVRKWACKMSTSINCDSSEIKKKFQPSNCGNRMQLRRNKKKQENKNRLIDIYSKECPIYICCSMANDERTTKEKSQLNSKIVNWLVINMHTPCAGIAGKKTRNKCKWNRTTKLLCKRLLPFSYTFHFIFRCELAIIREFWACAHTHFQHKFHAYYILTQIKMQFLIALKFMAPKRRKSVKIVNARSQHWADSNENLKDS